MQKIIIAFFSTLILAGVPAIAEAKTATLGGGASWPALSFSDGIAKGKGRLGKEALVLSTDLPSDAQARSTVTASGSAESPASDLYLPFDSKDEGDRTGHYAVVSSAMLWTASSKARRGAGAALCNTDGSGLVLRGNAGSLFATPGDPGSFSIDFWLFPSVTENGSIIFEWRSSRISTGNSIYQYIRADIIHNHLEWKFSNIWTTVSGKPFDVTVEGTKNLIPGVWTHHVLSYDAAAGLVEYRLDGSTESVVYVTSTGSERGDIYSAIFGTASNINICPRFSGLLDEFKISRAPFGADSLESRHALLERYPSGGGRFESLPIDSGALNSTLNGISVVKSEPAGTGTAFFVRSGDNIYTWTGTEPAWIPVTPGEKLTGITGRYFQVAGNLYPDGTGSSTPSVTSVTLSYEEDSPPWPPVHVRAAPLDGAVTLTWPASVDYDTAGYLVYYGDHPGEYLGAGSPLDAGNARTITVPGLKNGKMYHFSIAAYDASGPRYPGTLSDEVSARPQARRGE